MADKKSFKSTFLTYALNISILLLFCLAAWLAYSFISKSFTKNSESKKEITDTTGSTVTNQPNYTIQLDVQNGTSEKGAAQKFTEYLRSKGFDVVEMGNYRSNDVDKTIIIDRSGNKINASKVAKSLGVSERNIIQQINTSLYLEVTVVIGKDYKELKPYNTNIK
jgi:hypothetical protein